MTSASTAPAELRWVHPSHLVPNSWNPNVVDEETFQKAVTSIRRFGFVDPITVRRAAGDALFEIIDGEHRWRAAKQEDLDLIPIFDLGEISDSVAQQLTVVLNELRGTPEPKKLGELLRTLMATETKESLLSTLPYTREALDRLTGLPSLNWDDLDRPTRPQLTGQRPSAWVERTYRMPKDAAAVIDRAILRIRELEDQDDIQDWRALELLAADFLGA